MQSSSLLPGTSQALSSITAGCNMREQTWRGPDTVRVYATGKGSYKKWKASLRVDKGIVPGITMGDSLVSSRLLEEHMDILQL